MSLLSLGRSRLLMATSRPLLRTFTTSPLQRQEATSTILPRLKADLKDAMRSKNKARLDVLRALLAEITNASKTTKPVTSDAHLYVLLQKQIAGSQKAMEEFEAAKREDLVEKERGQQEVLKGYVGEIPTVGDDEVAKLVEEAIQSLGGKGDSMDAKAKAGRVMGLVTGKIKGRAVDMGVVKRAVENAVASKA